MHTLGLCTCTGAPVEVGVRNPCNIRAPSVQDPCRKRTGDKAWHPLLLSATDDWDETPSGPRRGQAIFKNGKRHLLCLWKFCPQIVRLWARCDKVLA